MRRVLLCLALFPGITLAQTYSSQLNDTTSTNPASTTQLANGVRMVGSETAIPTAPNGPVSAYQIQAQQSGSAMPSSGNRQGSPEMTGTSQSTSSERPQTAAEQGYVADHHDEDAAALAAYQAAHTPRQLGEVVTQPAPYRPIAHEPSLAGWYANWSYTLARAGVPDAKIAFEAQRLDQTSFSAWANRQLRATEIVPSSAP